MKKFGVIAMIVLCFFMLTGCGEKKSFDQCISEITRVYYQASNGQVEGSISVGEREEPYLVDGRQEKLCEFSLIVVDFNKLMEEETIEVALSINGAESVVTLYLNPVNHYYMNDLGYSLGQNDEVILTYQDITLTFFNISDSFNIDFSQAITIAGENLNLQAFYQDGDFRGECYLKILTEKNDVFQDLFWHFSVVGENGEIQNIVINTLSGEFYLS